MWTSLGASPKDVAEHPRVVTYSRSGFGEADGPFGRVTAGRTFHVTERRRVLSSALGVSDVSTGRFVVPLPGFGGDGSLSATC